MRFSAACSRSLAAALLAFTASAEAPRDAPGSELAELMQAMAATSGVVANFRERKQLALLEKPLESSGTLYFVPPDRLARFTRTPEPSALIINGEKLRFQQGDGEKFDLSGNPMARIFIDNFIALFNGDLPRLRGLYHTNFSADGENWTLILEPRHSPLRGIVKQIALRGDGRGIREMVMHNRDGDRTSTTLDVIRTDYPFTDGELEELFAAGIAPACARRHPVSIAFTVFRGVPEKRPLEKPRPAVSRASDRFISSSPGTMTPPTKVPSLLRISAVVAVPAPTTRHGPCSIDQAPMSAAQRSAPSCAGRR